MSRQLMTLLALVTLLGAGCRSEPNPTPCPREGIDYRGRCVDECELEHPDSLVRCNSDTACDLGCSAVQDTQYMIEETGCNHEIDEADIYPIDASYCRAEFEVCRDECFEDLYPDDAGCGVDAGVCIQQCWREGYACWPRS